jgi:lysophospholipase L1-like esterase
VVYYGSSITQGGCASRPGKTYQDIICRRFDYNYINLGFSGSAKGEDAICEHMATLDMSAFVLDYDHNTPSEQNLIDTHEPFYKKVRAAHPDIPIIMVTAPNTKLQGNVNYAGRGFLYNRREIIRKTYENAVAAGDQNVYFIDGESFFGTVGRDSCTIDNCHPNDLGFYRMAEQVWRVLSKIVK